VSGGERTVGRAGARAAALLAAGIVAALALGACGRGAPEEPKAERDTTDEKSLAGPPGGRERGRGAPLVEMRNLRLLVLEDAVLEVKTLSGALEPTAEDGVAFFDDPRSFRILIDNAESSIDAENLAALLNGYTFAYDGAPLEDLEVEIADGRIRQKGKLNKKIEVPFEVEASLSLTGEGLLRLHPEKIEAADVPVTKALDLFDIELQDVINARTDRGLRVDGDDLLLDPDRLMPPPAIRGRVGEARIEGDRIVLVFVPPAGRKPRARLSPPLDNPNYMFFRGGQLRFGKLEMTDTDLVICDGDPRDPFLFFLSRYKQQLVAGTTRTLDDLGLVGTFPDYDEAGPGKR
jgi:hypothetical protein